MADAVEIRRYTTDDAGSWDRFIAASKNGTFLFRRDFMDYHADRFTDHSLIFSYKGQDVAVLPANERDGALMSHGGLTYGGMISGTKMGVALMLKCFDAIRAYMRAQRLSELTLKPVPPIYHSQPAEEDLYALFRNRADLTRVDVSATIALGRRLPFASGKKDGLRKARKADLDIRESDDWAACWNLLTQMLETHHDTAPTHALDEITRLKAAFPDEIRLFAAHAGAKMVAALVVFDCGPCVHVQYITASNEGRAHGGIDAIVHHLVENVFADRLWFDFGISTTDAGWSLNEGLARQKEMFGARTTIYQQFRMIP